MVHGVWFFSLSFFLSFFPFFCFTLLLLRCYSLRLFYSVSSTIITNPPVCPCCFAVLLRCCVFLRCRVPCCHGTHLRRHGRRTSASTTVGCPAASEAVPLAHGTPFPGAPAPHHPRRPGSPATLPYQPAITSHHTIMQRYRGGRVAVACHVRRPCTQTTCDHI